MGKLRHINRKILDISSPQGSLVMKVTTLIPRVLFVRYQLISVPFVEHVL